MAKLSAPLQPPPVETFVVPPDDFAPPTDGLPVVEAQAELVTELKAGRNELGTIVKAQVKEFVQNLEQGVGPQIAATMAGTSYDTLVRNPVTRKIVQEFLTAWALPAEVRKALVRARLNQVLLTAADNKEIIAASRAIGADPEVGLEGKAPAVQVAMQFNDEVKAIFADAAEHTIPGITIPQEHAGAPDQPSIASAPES